MLELKMCRLVRRLQRSILHTVMDSHGGAGSTSHSGSRRAPVVNPGLPSDPEEWYPKESDVSEKVNCSDLGIKVA
jgi:hypothetical protein